MAPSSSKSNPPRTRKRVEVESTSLKRAKDGSAFTKCEACNKDVPVGLIDMHNCSLDSKIKMNLESQVVENVTEVKKPGERKKVGSSEVKGKKDKKEKKVKDPNMPKRPATAFFIFMDGFRKTFKEANPDEKSVAVVAKEGGEKWKSMTDEEKKPYLEVAAKRKAEYEKAMEKFNAGNKEEQGGSDSDKEE
ncbi:high mobility group B protein 7-like isoform X2 [Tasmannia lanceolata]|uniref:high mobility group B protein 7-like isoform X2 n=1 Tax=Tasmannia lanceolata TaxID=3420 RepID=UPI004063A1CC